MNILLLGSGGREHALAWKMASSPLLDRLFCAPGNAGIGQEAELVALDVRNHKSVITFAKTHDVDLVVVGPEAPLVAGLVDDLEAAGIRCFGPSRAAARLEGSKVFTKDLCRANAIPTAAYERFSAPTLAKAYVRKHGVPVVIKADGLAAGKGVVVAESLEQAQTTIEAMLGDSAPGQADEIVVEEFVDGEEASFFVLCDGQTAIPLGSAQDHKRAFDGDKGPNTGGMGAYSPAPVLTPELCTRVMAEIVRPTLDAMQRMGTPYRGVLYAGLMVNRSEVHLLEYNVRFGDPECQALMPRLMSDLVPALIATRDGALRNFDLRWYPEVALAVVLASRGYPGDFRTGSVIEGLNEASAVEGVEIFHAGTRREGDRIIANGGRVLTVSALARSVTEAQARAYAAIEKIRWPEGFYRHDIGWRAVARERQ